MGADAQERMMGGGDAGERARVGEGDGGHEERGGDEMGRRDTGERLTGEKRSWGVGEGQWGRGESGQGEGRTWARRGQREGGRWSTRKGVQIQYLHVPCFSLTPRLFLSINDRTHRTCILTYGAATIEIDGIKIYECLFPTDLDQCLALSHLLLTFGTPSLLLMS